MTDTAKTYGGAFYDLAQSEQLTDALLRDLQLVSAMFAENPGYGKLLANPALAKAERRQLIDEAWRDQVHLYTRNFLKLLCDNGTIRQLPDCASEYQRRYNADHGILAVRAVSAVPLRPELQEKLRQKIASITGKTIELTVRVDEQLLGGVRLELPDRQLDGSVQYHLDALARKLREPVLHSAQSGGACDQ